MSPKAKDAALRIRISESDLALLRRAAERVSPLGMDLTAYVLSAALEAARRSGTPLVDLRKTPLTKSVQLLVAADDKAVLERAASRASLSLSAFITSAALEKAKAEPKR